MTILSPLGRWGKVALLAAARSIPFILAVPCALLAPFFVLTIPGDPATTTWQIAYWLVLWASLAAYPLTAAIIGGRLRSNRKTQRIRGIWRQLWVTLGLMVVIWSPILVIFANEEVRKAQSRANMPIERKLEYAIRHGPPEETHVLITGGADVNMRLFNDGTAAQLAAEQGDWDMVIWLLQRGAEIDHTDRMGWSLRRVVAEAPEETDPDRAASLATVRSMIVVGRGSN